MKRQTEREKALCFLSTWRNTAGVT